MDHAAKPGRLNILCFWLLWATSRLLLRVFFRLRIEGRPPVSGAFVLAANHASLLDPVVVGVSLRRRVVFLMTEVIYRSRLMGWFYRWNRTIPVAARGVNREPLRAARRALREGKVVGIFPEGGISRDGLPMLGSPGAVSLVLNEGVPIVPVGLIGTGCALPPGARRPRLCQLTVRFGEPIAPDDLAVPGLDRRARLQRATRLIMDRIAALTGHVSRADELERLREEAHAG